jgi:release factor glutamine methyltransferase
VAQRNAQRHHIENRIEFVESDLFSAIEPGRFGLIVSNPPYVRDAELKVIQREVRYEPRAALAAGPDGLVVIRRLLQESRPRLRPGGHLVFEIGFGQEEAVRSLIDQRVWKLLDVRVDLQAIARTFVLQRK